MDDEFMEVCELKLMKPLGNKNILKETFDRKKLCYIVNHEDEIRKRMRPISPDYNPFELARKYLANSIEDVFINKYEYFDDHNFGRLTTIFPFSMQHMMREMRHAITKDLYYDIDMVNAHANILSWLCTKLGIEHKYVEQYTFQRDEILEELMNLNNLDRIQAKAVVISVMNGKTGQFSNLRVVTPFLHDLIKDMRNIVKELMTFFPVTLVETKRFLKRSKKSYNPEGSFSHTIMTTIENRILQAMLSYFIKEKLVTDNAILFYDGILIPKSISKDEIEKHVPKCEAYVLEALGVHVDLLNKLIQEGVL